MVTSGKSEASTFPYHQAQRAQALHRYAQADAPEWAFRTRDSRPESQIPSPASGWRETWARKTADSRRWTGKSSVKSPAREARWRTRKGARISGTARRPGKLAVRADLPRISVVRLPKLTNSPDATLWVEPTRTKVTPRSIWRETHAHAFHPGPEFAPATT